MCVWIWENTDINIQPFNKNCYTNTKHSINTSDCYSHVLFCFSFPTWKLQAMLVLPTCLTRYIVNQWRRALNSLLWWLGRVGWASPLLSIHCSWLTCTLNVSYLMQLVSKTLVYLIVLYDNYLPVNVEGKNVAWHIQWSLRLPFLKDKPKITNDQGKCEKWAIALQWEITG